MGKFIVSVSLAIFAVIALQPGEKEDKISSFPPTQNQQLYLISDTTADKGKKIYNNACTSCHKDTLQVLAPGLSILSQMSPKSIVAALESGKMRAQGSALSAEEKKAVAEWITGVKLKTYELPKEMFTSFSLPATVNNIRSGWGNNIEGTGFTGTSQAGITEENIGSLKLKWAIPFPEATIMRTRPAIVDNWLIVGSQYGDVAAIDRNTGKIGWIFSTGAAIRGAITVTKKGTAITAYFANFTTTVYAVDVRTGKQLWSVRTGVDAMSSVTGSVTLYNDILYVPLSSTEVGSAVRGDYACCISSGGLAAVQVSTGKLMWQHRVVPPAQATGKRKNGVTTYGPSGAPVWCSPTIDKKRNLVYIGTGQNYSAPASTGSDAIQALDLKTGKLKWSFQATQNDMYNVACPFFENCPDKKSPDFDFGMAPIVMKRSKGKDILVVGQKAGIVWGIDPDNGKPVWQTRVGKGGKLGGLHWGMATDGKLIYAANADNAVALELSDTSLKASPGIYALKPDDGSIVWKTATPCANPKVCMAFNSAAPAVIPGIVFAGSTDGKMRAYQSSTGEIIWEYDSNKSYGEINGFKARGGSIDGPPPVIDNGMLFFNSGYGMFGQAPGNMLLAFEVEKK
ncbi:PQQ-binding-like beta-propeller repeat protein [Pollutibacter soli]|uniref:outer membrane protein assembly factor BamB family protein n=1 Tax=Pollutibacter soli TaxID=3034157 RepID=UPI003013E805